MYHNPMQEASVKSVVFNLGLKWARHCRQVMIAFTASIEAVWAAFQTKAFFLDKSPFIGFIECLRLGLKSENWLARPRNDLKLGRSSGIGN